MEIAYEQTYIHFLSASLKPAGSNCHELKSCRNNNQNNGFLRHVCVFYVLLVEVQDK